MDIGTATPNLGMQNVFPECTFTNVAECPEWSEVLDVGLGLNRHLDRRKPTGK